LKRSLIIFIILFYFVFNFMSTVDSQSIDITGGDILLTIPPELTVEDTTTGLIYSIQSDPSNWYKITVATDLPFPNFVLTVQATNIITSIGPDNYGGDAQGAVTLGTTPQPLILNIKHGNLQHPHSCTLKYTASVTLFQDFGTDVHTITYTIIIQ
jgi:hypothetical protein